MKFAILKPRLCGAFSLVTSIESAAVLTLLGEVVLAQPHSVKR